ncbi:unnamed protein product [Rhizophagus irregularis]|nr:unnamed protein product [Rhizophagus irregularis]
MSEFASTATEDKHAHTLAKHRSNSSVQTSQSDLLEFMRNEYVAAILHAALNIARVDTQKEFSMRSQCEMLGEESIGRVDYAIKDSEHLFRQDLSR